MYTYMCMYELNYFVHMYTYIYAHMRKYVYKCAK